MKIVFFLFSFFLFSPLNLKAAPQPEALRKHMLSDLDFIRHSFEIKYSPTEWKKGFADWDLDFHYQVAKAQVMSLEKPTVKDCQVILKEFFHSPKDYHVSISFLSTESATLPFMGMWCDGGFFVVFSDTDLLEKGDEILTCNGTNIGEALEQFRKVEIGNNTLETDQSLASIFFTNRLGTHGHRVPKGQATFTVKKKESNDIQVVKLDWIYQEEIIKSPGRNAISLNSQILAKNPTKKEEIKSFFQKMMISPLYFNLKNPFAENKYWLGSRESFIPRIGKAIWESDEDDVFDAYIFKITDTRILPPGKKSLQVGYVRIPHYGAGDKEAEEFQKIIDFLDYKTEALIIDQNNNPGGSVFYLYALASMLTDKPLEAPKHRISLTQEDVAIASLILEAMEPIADGDDRAAQEIFGDTLGGYHIDFHFIKACRIYCRHLIDEWNQGNLFTSPIHLYGVDEIQPHPRIAYSKPILVLINSLDFSGGDFFPAILQDNKRAKLLGTRTAGAGGYVGSTTFPNLLGIGFFNFTNSFALRDNQLPLENLGVTPDISYTLTKKDIETNYNPYIQKILESVCQLFDR